MSELIIQRQQQLAEQEVQQVVAENLAHCSAVQVQLMKRKTTKLIDYVHNLCYRILSVLTRRPHQCTNSRAPMV